MKELRLLDLSGFSEEDQDDELIQASRMLQQKMNPGSLNKGILELLNRQGPIQCYNYPELSYLAYGYCQAKLHRAQYYFHYQINHFERTLRNSSNSNQKDVFYREVFKRIKELYTPESYKAQIPTLQILEKLELLDSDDIWKSEVFYHKYYTLDRQKLSAGLLYFDSGRLINLAINLKEVQKQLERTQYLRGMSNYLRRLSNQFESLEAIKKARLQMKVTQTQDQPSSLSKMYQGISSSFEVLKKSLPFWKSSQKKEE